MIEDLFHRRATQLAHPIGVKFGFVLQTTTIEFVHGLLSDWIELGKSGIAFAGESRAGKTYAIREVTERLRRDFPQCVVICLSSETETPHDANERTYSAFLQQLSVPIAENLRRRSCDGLVHYLLSRCRDLRARQCVVLVDEAQKLGKRQWEALGIVWNRLESQGVGMSVFSFGNDDLRAKAQLASDGGLQGVMGRYFVRSLDFEGISSEEALTAILGQYDDRLWHPSPGWPFSRYFAMEAYDKNRWRLAAEGEKFWKALCTYYGVTVQQQNAPGYRGFPMQWVTDPIHFILKDCLNTPECRPGEMDLPWDVAIETVCPTYLS